MASDIDAGAGVAAVWLVHRAGGPDAVHEYCQFECIRGSWQYLGGGRGGREFLPARRPSASRAGPAAMMTSLSGCAGRSRSDREAQGDQRDLGRVDWVACAMFRVAAEVAHLEVGARRIKIPPAWLHHRRVEGAAFVRVTLPAADCGCKRRWQTADGAWPRRSPGQPDLGIPAGTLGPVFPCRCLAATRPASPGCRVAPGDARA